MKRAVWRSFAPWFLAAPICGAAAARHIPHDASHGIAVAPLPGGGLEMVVVTSDYTKVLRSRDDGLTWEVLSGAGLETVLPSDIVYHAGLAPPRFLIGTCCGVWSYDPASGLVERADAGLAAGDRDVVDMAAPDPGSDGPALLVASSGAVYAWDEAARRWVRLLATGLGQHASAVAVVPHFDSQAPPGPLRALAAAVNGVLYLSDDGGASWQVQPQFSQPAASARDWWILALAFAEDFETSGVMVVGRARQHPAGGLRQQGELWRSGDFGASFQRAHFVATGVESLCATPPDAAGRRWLLAAGPYEGGRPVGWLRSGDGGVSWDDYGNGQDLILEEGSGLIGTGVRGWLRFKQGFAVSPYFASDGMLLHARSEGVFQSRDTGWSWRQKQLRSERELRDVAVGLDPGGGITSFGAAYGSGTVAQDLAGAGTVVLAAGDPMAWQKEVEVSPRYDRDGTVAVSGDAGLFFWFDPRVPPANPYGTSGWVDPPLRDIASGQELEGYVRTVAISPHFDARGVSGRDRTVYFGAWGMPPMRTEDCGLTAEQIPNVQGGGTVAFFELMAIAPTYDAGTPAGRRDVYGVPEGTGELYRLEDSVWVPVHEFAGTQVTGLVVDPDFARPANPRLFLSLHSAPYAVALWDHPGAPIVQSLRFGLGADTALVDLAVPPDFALRPVLYAMTWGEGVLRADLSAAAPAWDPLGTGYPPWFAHRLVLSPGFAQDRALLVASSRGFVRGRDAPGAPWTPLGAVSRRDNDDPSFAFFAPGDPANPQPLRPWPWARVPDQALPGGLLVFGPEARYTSFDGSFVLGAGYARELRLHTVSGPGTGVVALSASDYWTGAALASVQVDLGALTTTLEEAEIALPLPAFGAVQLRVEALLQPGERLLFDGVSFVN